MAKTLFVSSSDTLHKRIKDLMELEGLEIIPCKVYDEAIRVCRRLKPEIAMIDIFFADRSGLDLAKEFITDNSETRILMMSDVDTHSMRNYALRCGARDLLVKPFSNAEFIFTLKKYMEDLNVAKN